MWPDNETERDFLNFSGVAETAAEIIVQAKGRPISIGVSGAWGIGKSSMIKLTRSAVAAREDKGAKKASDKYVFVEFNAWLYQGYDDAVVIPCNCRSGLSGARGINSLMR
jgi:predicted KAP-like P-loop ATPase